MKTATTFQSNGKKIAAELYLPADYKPGERRRAVVVSHPFGGVKEQTAGLYASKLAEQGLVALTFDAAHQGASEGMPRYLEDPFQRAEDIRSAGTHLSTLDQVDADRIGVLGICASGGYVTYTAQTDARFKAVATVSAADMGLLFREGLGGSSSRQALQQTLAEVAEQRTREAEGAPVRLDPVVPESPEQMTPDTPDLYREGSNYYRTPRAQHPRSTNQYAFTSIDRIAAYSSFDHVDLIAPRPLMMIAGSRADTRYFSEMACAKAGPNAKLVVVDGASHIDLYDKPEYVDPAVQQLSTFFDKSL